jgi:hypothetical protein
MAEPTHAGALQIKCSYQAGWQPPPFHAVRYKSNHVLGYDVGHLSSVYVKRFWLLSRASPMAAWIRSLNLPPPSPRACPRANLGASAWPTQVCAVQECCAS